MSVIVKGLEMPKICGQCQIKLGIDCEFWKHVRSVSLDRHKDCPLTPVPPHGDLIDRDQFIEFIKTHWDSYDQWFVEQLEARPTIIPAEEE